VNAEFNWWLLIVGLVTGAGLVWLVVLDSRRRESDVDAVETAREALWLSTILGEEGAHVTPATAERLLELHKAYLASPPPDDPDEEVVDPDADEEPVDAYDRPREPQDWPSRTGSASVAGDPTSTSDTPNAAGPSSPAIASEGPAQ
jgi:hypothetical protein